MKSSPFEGGKIMLGGDDDAADGGLPGRIRLA